MLTFSPQSVTFASVPLDQVFSIAIDRAPQREVVEWSDAGPHPVFADVAEQRTEVKLLMEITRDAEVGALLPGRLGVLSFECAPGASDAARRRITMQAVVLSVQHDLSARKAVRTARFVAVSPGGAADPVSVENIA